MAPPNPTNICCLHWKTSIWDGRSLATMRRSARYLSAPWFKQTTVRLPEDLAEAAEAVARVRGTSVNALIIESLSAEVARVRADKEFTTRANRLLKRDKELLDRLAR
jgi:glutamate-1-semialdehyde aminotransferase